MAKRRRNTFKLGITVIIMFILGFALTLFVAGGSLRTPPRSPILVRFRAGRSMPELTRGCDVRFLGRKVGFVESTSITIITDDVGDRAALDVVARVDDDVDLRSDCRIAASGPPLGGKGTLEILRRGRADNRATPGEPIKGEVRGFAAALDMVAAEVDEANPQSLLAVIKAQMDRDDPASTLAKVLVSLDDINATTASIRLEVDRQKDSALFAKIHRTMDHADNIAAALRAEMRRDVDDAMLAKLHVAVDKFREDLGAVGDIIAENRPNVDQSLKSLRSALKTFDEDIATVLASELDLDEEQDGTILEKLHASLSKADDTLANAKQLTADVRTTVTVNRERIDEIFENAVQASASLKQGIRDLKLHPWKLFARPDAGELRESQILDAAREFADASASLDDATRRLKSLLDGGTPSDDIARERIAEAFEALAAATQAFTTAENSLWKALDVR